MHEVPEHSDEKPKKVDPQIRRILGLGEQDKHSSESVQSSESSDSSDESSDDSLGETTTQSEYRICVRICVPSSAELNKPNKITIKLTEPELEKAENTKPRLPSSATYTKLSAELSDSEVKKTDNEVGCLQDFIKQLMKEVVDVEQQVMPIADDMGNYLLV